MKSRNLIAPLALVAIAGLGWLAYTYMKQGGTATGFEVKGSASPQAQGPSAAPGSRPGGSGSPAATGQGSGQTGGSGGPPGAAPGAGPGGGRGGPVSVEVAPVTRRALIEEAVAAGTLRANDSVILRSEVSGRVARVGFTDAARVRRDTVLIELDASIASAEVEQAKAELGLAQANYQRTSELAERNFVSRSARDQSAANLAVLEARLRLAQARLAKSEIRAPFDGTMGLRNVSVGDFVREGTDLAVIEEVSSMKVDLRLPERYLSQLRKGQRIRIEVDSFPGRSFVALLEAVDVQVDTNGRALIVRGRLPNPDSALRSGMYARATVALRENPAALMVPEEALIPQGNSLFVYRVQDGKATRTAIQIGLRRDGQVEIMKGLEESDQVVTAGQLRLGRDVHEVRVVNAARSPDRNAVKAPAPGADKPQAPVGGPPPAPAGGPPPASVTRS